MSGSWAGSGVLCRGLGCVSMCLAWSRARREWQVFAHKIVGFSGPDDVQWTEGAEPAADGGVVIDVVAASMSFADLLQTKGAYQMKVPLPYMPGLDAAVVYPVCPARCRAGGGPAGCGAAVAWLLAGGHQRPGGPVLPLLADRSFEAGAAAPLNYLTALFALARRARAQAGETLLVHGAAGGGGTAAIAVGRALGMRTVAVVCDQAKKQFARSAGPTTPR